MDNFNVKEFDVLIIGGGIAGCMAGIRARESGVSVAILEKGNTLRSGCASTGIDHCWSYIPEIHEKIFSLDDLVDDHVAFGKGMVDRSLVKMIAANSYNRVRDLEHFGVPMRDEKGNFRLIKKIHRTPTFIHFAGRDLKVKLTKEARKRGVVIENRVMVTDLLVNEDRVAGALALATREGRWNIYKGKTVIIATGGVYRLYRNPTGMPFNISHAPHASGDGHAMAFRAGARLLNMEMVDYHTGPKNFQRAGRGSYVPGVMRNGLGELLGKGNAGSKNALDRSAENIEVFRSIIRNGQGPLYMDCTANTKEQNDYIRWALSNEGNTSFLNYLDEEGIDINKDMIEFTVYEPKISGGQSGIEINTECETSLRGLYAAGDVIGGIKRSVCPGALVMGWIAGENAAKLAKDLTVAELDEKAKSTIQARTILSKSFSKEKETGSSWLEAQLAIQNIMENYAGEVKSQILLTRGLKQLSRMRELVEDEVKAETAHELYRAMEVMSLLDVGEMLITAALARKESRGVGFQRSDYPETNENWLKFISLEKKAGGITVQERPINLV